MSVFRILFLLLASLHFENAWAKPPVMEGEEDPVMLDLDPYLKEALYDNRYQGRFGNDGSIVHLSQEPAFQKLVQKHQLECFNGPMLGDITDQSIKIWIRTSSASRFKAVVDKIESKWINTTAESDFTGIAFIGGLKPFTEYSYRLILNDQSISKPYFRFKTAPATGQAAKFSVTFGSGSRYIPKNERIWRTMNLQKPLAYLGLGDNIYIDVPKHQNVHRYMYYRRMLRQEHRETQAQSGIYSIWDDHDMYDDDSEGGYGLNTTPWKMPTFKVFTQNWNNPFNGLPPKNPGTFFNFRLGDVEFFMLDGRFYRYGLRHLKNAQKGKELQTTMLGQAQLEWLISMLKKSTAKFKVLASGTMWHDLADKGGRDSWASEHFRHERELIFNTIDQNKINGVILISGDRHRTDIWKTERPNGYPLFEFLSAKLTNVHRHNDRKEALWSHRAHNGIDGLTETFWGQLDFDTTLSDPTVTFKAINMNQKLLKSYSLKLSQLSHSK